jgi:eukaryotic-like serine/threonine-protein kinase
MCLQPGHLLHDGRYEIIIEIGRGGGGITYKAFDRNNPENSLCVVKKILPPRSNHTRILQEAQAQFEKEASSLEHLHNCGRIPKLIDRFQENGNFYLIQEYIEGQPLNKEIVRGHQFAEQEVINLLSDILSVLDIIHKQRIIHRDIKPSNLIRRQPDNKIVLIDFGAVKGIRNLAIEGGQITQTRAIGTEGYMPAEQCKNQPKFNSDIYAAGIIGIQALTGLRIEDFFHDKETCEVIWHYATPDRPIVQINNELERILNKMVRYNFTVRYQSAAEVLKDLNDIVVFVEDSNPPELQSDSNPPELQSDSNPPDLQSDSNSPDPRSLLKWVVALGIAGIAVVSAIVISRLLPVKFSSASNSFVLGDSISSGEEILVQTSAHWSKQRGIIEFARSNYQEALKLLKQSWHQYRKDPETLIYMNNALLEEKKIPYYTIAIVVPLRRNQQGEIINNASLAEELLRGIAQAQTEVNLGLLAEDRGDRDFPGQGFLSAKSINGKGLKVIVADDGNIKPEAVKRADALVKIPDILGVIGHYTSDMTVETVDIYDRNKLVAISPGSTTEELTRLPRKFFFRTAPTTSSEAESLVRFLIEIGEKRVAGFYNPNSPFTASFWEEFKKQFEEKGGIFVRIREFEDLSKSDFNAEKAIQEVQKMEKTAILVIPDGQVTDATENALATIKANGNYNWIVGPWTLYEPRTLAIAKQLKLSDKMFDKIVISVHWHPLTSKNKKFPEDAVKLWGGAVNTRTALTYDATKTMIKALEIQQEPSREGMQKMLSDPNFIAEGATGTIQFESKTGNRKNPPQQLAHIVECPKEEFGVTFVPIEFPTASAAGLKCE